MKHKCAVKWFGIVTALSLGFTHGAEFSMKTYTFKSSSQPGASLEADVYRPPAAGARPAIVFIHGGALMMGTRALSTKPDSLLASLTNAGFVVVSIDYHLAPQVKLPAILEEVQEAFKWVREQGPELFRIDPRNIFAMGQSAGGYLSLVAGSNVQPRPKAVVSFWGYGDIAGEWYSRPDPFYLKQPLVPKEEADRTGGSRLYLYCRQQGLWPKVLTGYDPATQPKAFDPFCPVRNVSKDYPPTLLIHGTKDTDVPYEQSVLMAAELKKSGVRHELITIRDGGHGFGRNDAAIASRTYEQVVRFLKAHLE